MMFRFTFEGRDAAIVDVRTSAVFGQMYRPMRVREAGTLVGSAHTFNFANDGTGSFDVTVVDGVATINVDASGGGGGDVPGSRQVIAGAGLTGGGDLTADRTLNVAANADASIVVNANDIQVGVLATDAQHGLRGGGTQHSAATTSVAGFMSAADKTKLDGVASGATAYTDELAQDAVGGALADTATINFTYDDATPAISADVIDGSISLAKMANVATDRLIGRDTAGTGVPEALTVGGGVEFTGSGGIQRSALTGDVTASAGSASTTIANDAVTTAKIANAAVTYAKLQDVSAASRLLGRGSASGSGDAEEISLGSGLTMTGTTLSASGGGGGSGDVVGPSSATDNAIARFDSTTGKLIQNSAVTIDDSGNIATAGTVDGRDVSTDGSALDSHVANTSNPHSVTIAQVSSKLATVDALTWAADRVAYFTGAATSALATLTSFGRSIVALADAAAARALFDLEPGTDVQAYDAELAAIAGLTSAADSVPYFTGSGTAALATVTAAARTVLDDTTVAAMVDTLGGAASTGTGGIARATSPTFVTPTLGAAAATSLTLTNDLPISEGGTGQSTATAAFDALAPTTTAGDIIYNNGTDNVRLPIGTATQVLTVNAGATAPEWATPSGGSGSVATDTIWDAKGDLAGGTGSNTASRLAVGTNGHVLTADSAEATGLKWAAADISAASESAAGKAELATQAETDAGTDDARIITPLKLAGRLSLTRAALTFRHVDSCGWGTDGSTVDVPFYDDIRHDTGPAKWTAFYDEAATRVGAISTTRKAAIRLDVGTNGSGWIAFGVGIEAFVFGGVRHEWFGRVAVEDLSDGTNRYILFAGFTDQGYSPTLVDGCFFRYTDNVNSGRFECVCESNSVETVADSGITVAADTDYDLGVIVNAAGTSVAFYIDETLVATITTDIPTGTTRATGARVGLDRVAGSTNRYAYVSTFAFEVGP